MLCCGFRQIQEAFSPELLKCLRKGVFFGDSQLFMNKTLCTFYQSHRWYHLPHTATLTFSCIVRYWTLVPGEICGYFRLSPREIWSGGGRFVSSRFERQWLIRLEWSDCPVSCTYITRPEVTQPLHDTKYLHSTESASRHVHLHVLVTANLHNSESFIYLGQLDLIDWCVAN